MLLHQTDNIEHLVKPKIRRTMVELTRKCNLRCIYCAVSQPSWKHESMDLEEFKLEDIIKNLKSIGNEQIILHGHGETTIVPNWDEYAELFMDNGFELITCTNMNKDFSDHEISVLSRFVAITVSIDTPGPKKFSQLRRGAQIKRLVSNMQRINEHRVRHGLHGSWNFSSVITKETINDLPELISLGLSLGVTTFSLCNLTKIGDVPLTHLAELTPEEATEAHGKLLEAKRICEATGVYFDPKGGLVEALEQACQSN